MDYSESSPTNMLFLHTSGIEEMLNARVLEAKNIPTLEDAHDNLRAWYHKCFLDLISTMKGQAFTEYIGLRFDRKLAKDAIAHAVNSHAGHTLRKQYHLSEEEHKTLEEAEIKFVNRLNQEYATLKDRIPSRIKNTRSIEYYLCDITADDLGRQFPPTLEVRGAGAKVAKIISREIACGRIIRTDNFSEFYRCLVITYGDIIPKQQQISREVRQGGCHDRSI